MYWVRYLHFPDGSECDEWALSQWCKPGILFEDCACRFTRGHNPLNDHFRSRQRWLEYLLNEEFGYSFHYPAYTAVIMNEDPQKSITISGLQVENETGRRLPSAIHLTAEYRLRMQTCTMADHHFLWR
jgi:hypothetical protein